MVYDRVAARDLSAGDEIYRNGRRLRVGWAVSPDETWGPRLGSYYARICATDLATGEVEVFSVGRGALFRRAA